MSETVTVTWGKELIAPVQYNNFEVGPFTVTTAIRADETPEAAMARAQAWLDAHARKVYSAKLALFREHFAGAACVAKAGPARR